MGVAIQVLSVVFVIESIVVIVLGIGIVLLDIFGLIKTGVPFIPLPSEFANDVVRLAPGTSGIFYDLGSGNGHIVAAVARAYPSIRAVGIEQAPFPILVTTIMRRKYPANAEFIFRDFHRIQLSNATYVFTYLFPKTVHALEQKFEQELKPGTRVVCCDFPLKERKPNRIVDAQYGKKYRSFYVYDF